MSILICYDGSPSAKHALTVASATTGHGHMTILHVWNPPADFLADSFGTTSAPNDTTYAELERFAVERANAIAQEGHDLARQLGLTVDVRVQRNESSVWRTILDVAAETDSELIVVGTHGATAVQSALLGSVSNALLHHSKLPVLVVPAAAGQ
jgi:nucleotide-binding universal stress UspA family protein